MLYLYIAEFIWRRIVRKIQKRYYVLLFVAMVALGAILRDVYNSNTFEIIKDTAVYAPETENVIIDEAEYSGYLVNINTGTIPELSILPGIGEKTAEKIVEYRTQYGKFEVIEDIMKVPGIGNQKFEDIKNNITIE